LFYADNSKIRKKIKPRAGVFLFKNEADYGIRIVCFAFSGLWKWRVLSGFMRCFEHWRLVF